MQSSNKVLQHNLLPLYTKVEDCISLFFLFSRKYYFSWIWLNSKGPLIINYCEASCLLLAAQPQINK